MNLTEHQAKLLMEAVQGDRRACLTSAPRMTIPAGQTGRVNLQDCRHYVTGVTVTHVNGELQIVPQTTRLTTGLTMAITSSVSADHKAITLNLQAEHTYLESPHVPLSPVTLMATPKSAAALESKPVPVTQYIQQPKLRSLKIDTRVSVPTGNSMLVYGGVIERVNRLETSSPVMARIPYLNRLFKTTGSRSIREHLLVLVTPSIPTDCCPEAVACPVCPRCPTPTPAPEATASAAKPTTQMKAAATIRACGVPVPSATTPQVAYGSTATLASRPVPAPMPMAMPMPPMNDRVLQSAAKLVQMYREACARGQVDQARELARVALDLDPMCFARAIEGPMPVPLVMPARQVAPTPPMPILPPQPSFVPAAPVMPPPMAEPHPPIRGRGEILEPQWDRQYHLVVEPLPAGQIGSSRLKLEPTFGQDSREGLMVATVAK